MYNNYYKKSYQDVKQFLKPELRNFQKYLGQQAKTTLSWQDCVDETIFNNSAVIDISNGVLVVEIYHSSIKALINLQKKQILNKLNRQYSFLALKELKLVMGKRPVVKNNDQADLSFNNRVPKNRLSDAQFFSILERMKNYGKE